MVSVTTDFLEEIVRAIVNEVDPEKIVLFGSHARGDAQEDSDLDLIVIEALPFGPSRERWSELARIRKALSPYHVPKDILLFSSDEERHWRDEQNHVLHWGLQEGKLLYERS